MKRKYSYQFDEHIKILERSLAVTLISRDGVLKIVPGIECSARKGMSDTASGALTPRK